jgi:F0F1-type ATP synthase membrane subunit b/b'
VREEAHEEIERRLAAAKEELRAAAARLTANAAQELLSREINDQDRRRLLEESVESVAAVKGTTN